MEQLPELNPEEEEASIGLVIDETDREEREGEMKIVQNLSMFIQSNGDLNWLISAVRRYELILFLLIIIEHG